MSGDHMEVDAAEAKLKAMAHSEQHYFKRYVVFSPGDWRLFSPEQGHCC